MAQVKRLDGTKLLVQIETSPGVFAHDCLINASRGLSLSASGNDVNVPDCDDPNLPSWREKVIDSLSATISGGGLLHSTSYEAWFNWITGGASKNVRFRIDATAVNGGGYVAGAFKLTGLELTGERGDKSQVSVTLENDGPLTWTDAT